MATTEASAWAYVGYFLGSGSVRYFAALALGLIAGASVWIVDTSFVILDMRRREDQEMAEMYGQSRGLPKVRPLTKLQSPLAGIAIRLAMVAGSLYIAAPYVSQLFFARDVTVVLAKERSEDIQKEREAVGRRHDVRINILRQEGDTLRNQLVNEIAGQGPSHRFGSGPTTKAIEKQLHDHETQLQEAEIAKRDELHSYDNLPLSELAKKYGVVTAGDGIQARNRAMEIIKQQPGYSRTEWTIRALLLGLFLVLLVLKVYQPANAKIYYSAFCQDSYIRCLAGEFDALLGREKRRHWTPMAFDQWLRTDYKEYLRYSRNETIQGGIQANRTLAEKNFQKIQYDTESETIPLLEGLKDAQEEVQTLEDKIWDMQSELKGVDKEIADHKEAIKIVDAAIASPQSTIRSASGFKTTIGLREDWSDGLLIFEKKQTALMLQLDKAKAHLKRQQDHVKSIQDAIDARASVITNAQDCVTKSRNQALHDIAQGIS